MRKILFNILILLITSLLISCSARYITINSLNHNIEAFKGDTVQLNWNISNADYVKINGFDKRFSTNDYINIVADTTTNFILTAYSGKKDSVVRSINLNVKQTEAISGIDYSDTPDFILKESKEVNDFFTGIKNFSKEISISKVKITSIYKESENSPEFAIRFILLDDFGNFLDKIDLNENELQLSLAQTYGDEKYTHIYSKIKKCENKPSDISILLDNSLSSSNQDEILSEIDDFIGRLPSESNVMLSTYNHKYENLIQLTPKKITRKLLKNIKLKPNGLNSFFESIYQALLDLSKSNNNNKILIVLLNNSDNSSLTKDYTDCLELSKKLKIPVYFVIMNDFISTYPMKLISSNSGGYVFYKSDFSNNFNLSSLLSETELSSRFYYEIKAPFFHSSEKSKIIGINLNLVQNEEKISDKTLFYSSKIKTPNERKIIATFDEDQHRLKEEYADKIFTFAEMLIKNPEKSIRLFGHSSKNEDISSSESISLKRANEIKEKLINLGVKAEQIEVRDLGSSKPVYSFEQDEWQREMNRRVEFKWIEPSALPYEIIAQTTNSEYSAIKLTEEWEKQGFRSYFERTESMNEPIYKIKLWGFPSKEEAEKVIKKLNQKFSLVFDIE
ncbi:MAG: OmpA family protein [Candidatus Kapabacteria bacterium]|nr:OmpA family protein [Candidatus Kapabacteria bacterium]